MSACWIVAFRDRISHASEPGKAVLHVAVPGGGQMSFMVERALALRLIKRRMQEGTTFAAMVRAGDPDLAPLVRAQITADLAEHQAVDLDLARLCPVATLSPMAARRHPDLVVLEQGGTYRLSPSGARARDWLAA